SLPILTVCLLLPLIVIFALTPILKTAKDDIAIINVLIFISFPLLSTLIYLIIEPILTSDLEPLPAAVFTITPLTAALCDTEETLPNPTVEPILTLAVPPLVAEL